VATVTVCWVLFTYALLLLIIVALSQAVRKLARELGEGSFGSPLSRVP